MKITRAQLRKLILEEAKAGAGGAVEADSSVNYKVVAFLVSPAMVVLPQSKPLLAVYMLSSTARIHVNSLMAQGESVLSDYVDQQVKDIVPANLQRALADIDIS